MSTADRLLQAVSRAIAGKENRQVLRLIRTLAKPEVEGDDLLLAASKIRYPQLLELIEELRSASEETDTYGAFCGTLDKLADVLDVERQYRDMLRTYEDAERRRVSLWSDVAASLRASYAGDEPESTDAEDWSPDSDDDPWSPDSDGEDWRSDPPAAL